MKLLQNRSSLKHSSSILLCALLAMLACSAQVRAGTPDTAASAREQERKLVQLLQSGSPADQKALACKQLAIYGSKEAVPALAPLLSDPRLASWARIALEAIPGSAADQALRKAADKLQGRLLVGVINSIGVRRDAGAAGTLVKKLQDSDPEAASAAAVALGRIGGTKAAKALKQSLASCPPGLRPAAAEGAILCAESFLANGKNAQAVELYDTVRAAGVPQQKMLEATRGTILARRSAGLPLLLEQLRSDDKAAFGMGLRVARELPGRDVTDALAAELPRFSAKRQPMLLLALAEREDPAALPVIVNAARSGSKELRLMAIDLLDRSGKPSCMPVLLEVAAQAEPELAKAAVAVLARLPGNEVDASVLNQLPQAKGKLRQVLIELAEKRRLEGALPAIVPCAEDADAGVRAAAIQALGSLGSDKEAAGLVKLLEKTQNDRANIEVALIAISGRHSSACVPHLLPLAQNADPALRILALHVLAGAGGPAALASVKSGLDDQDETVQDEAARALSTWPNNWPDDSGVAEPLLALAKTGKKPSHQVLALRGYLQYVQNSKQLKNNEKVDKLKTLLPLLHRPEEQRLAITTLGSIPTGEALDLLTTFAADPAVSEDACAALSDLAGKEQPGVSAGQRRKALQTVVEKSDSADRKAKARKVLKELP